MKCLCGNEQAVGKSLGLTNTVSKSGKKKSFMFTFAAAGETGLELEAIKRTKQSKLT